MPRPRFNLRVVLAVTAIVAVAAWQYSIVPRRRAAMEADRHTFILALPLPGVPEPPGMAKISSWREFLGDRAVQSIYVEAGADKASEVARLQKLFPEAEIDPPPPVYTF